MASNLNRVLSFFHGIFAIILLFGCFFDTAKEEDAYQIEPPPKFPPMPVPANNPTTNAGVQLGRMLFYDPILSGDSTQSCASCHTQAFAFSDNGRRFSVGIHGDTGGINAPALTNPGWNPANFWDGRALLLEDQAIGPVANPIEMASKWPDVINKLKAHPVYSKKMKDLFGTSNFDSSHVAKAISQFERTMISRDSKYDKVLRGEATYTSEELNALNTMNDTKKGDCFHCHLAPKWGDGFFRSIGLDSTVIAGSGRAGVTKDPKDDNKWKTPTLRNLVFTAPYMHDGRFATLEDVLDHYNDKVVPTRTTDALVLKRILSSSSDPIEKMTREDMDKIIFFLKCCLTDSTYVTNPEYSNPFTAN